MCLNGVSSYMWFVPITWTKGGGYEQNYWLLSEMGKTFSFLQEYTQRNNIKGPCEQNLFLFCSSKQTQIQPW